MTSSLNVIDEIMYIQVHYASVHLQPTQKHQRTKSHDIENNGGL